MSRVEELLKEKEIADFLKTHQGAAGEIRAAAEFLANETDAKTSLIKLFPALTQKKISVFFSYKKKDEETAKIIVELLRKKSARKLKITYQYEFGDDVVGKKWRDKIYEEAGKANWFILLLPDPRDDWDWCLYETGLFEAQSTSADRLICLHHPKTSIPSPIEGYQAVKAENPDVDKFLRMIFLSTDPVPGFGPLNSDIEDEIPEMARKIVNAIRTPTKVVREIYEPWIELRIKNPGELENKDQLDQALVETANQKALDLFRLLKKKRTWGEFRRNLPGSKTSDHRWREDLLRVIRKIGNDLQFYPIQSVFQTREGKMYRPVVCAVDREGEDGPIKTFHLTFTEDVATVDRSAMPKNLSALANTLRSTFRFRWEILEKFGKGTMTEEDVERLSTALMRIQQDWESRSIGGEKEILELFQQKDEQKRILEMFTSWYKAMNNDKTGELDIAIENKDMEKIPKILKNFLPLNQEFLEMAADRFAKLVSGN
ncbi:MAG: toll/interleukin-1 receptor domain-containing protein [Proteobacteria bacterium]|nr:toll/interleukin-1 receptor domain-containing protein [Pseudomonadota bacterium]MBU1581386.1 toll/interleukin-1 receptor domain-containing protein [Pseudomonadota bacterium]MBU2453189.1 toll/interleukin-1 receptor domain-containing protein [Pseudomonadota bacterium]MBU2628840.1 toll/interleukin-1 receptor domain-containing protein [Pseudomonadota bacterium]